MSEIVTIDSSPPDTKESTPSLSFDRLPSLSKAAEMCSRLSARYVADIIFWFKERSHVFFPTILQKMPVIPELETYAPCAYFSERWVAIDRQWSCL